MNYSLTIHTIVTGLRAACRTCATTLTSTRLMFPLMAVRSAKHTIVHIDTEAFFETFGGDPAAAQLEWLTSDLADARSDPSIRWLIMVGHREFYSSSKNEEPWNARFAADVEAMLLTPGAHVDLYLSGHVHAYERFFPAALNASVPSPDPARPYHNAAAPVHIYSGAAGCPEGPDKWSSEVLPFSAKRITAETGAFGVLELESCDSISWTYYDAVTGSILDAIRITKDPVRKRAN